jgi:phosphoserine phosphatase
MNQQSCIPLCVDLDGTLIEDDVTLKALGIYVKRRFFNIFVVFFWMLHGRAYLKHKLAQCVDLDVESLRYRTEFLTFVRKRNEGGYRIFLATACNQVYANRIADYLGVFDGVFASTDRINLRASAKARALVAWFGKGKFDYAGNSSDDIPVWNESAECILVAPTVFVLKKMHGRKYLLFEK